MNRRSFLGLFGAASASAIVKPTYFFAPAGGWIKTYGFKDVQGFVTRSLMPSDLCCMPGELDAHLLARVQEQMAGAFMIPERYLFADPTLASNDDMAAYYEHIERETTWLRTRTSSV